MRRGNKPEIIVFSEQILGVNLSSDYCAEHEWGIKQIKREFGIPDDISVYGMPRRKITITPETVNWVSYDKREEIDGKKQMVHYEGFVYRPWYYEQTPSQAAANNSELTIYRPWKRIIGDAPTPSLGSAWSEGDFGVVSYDAETQKALKEIFENFATQNIVIMFAGTDTPFENPGLVIAIADRIPYDYVLAWYNADKDWHKVRKEVEAMGIEDLLKKAGRRYFALSPRRQEDGSIKFWLNPMEQDKNNFGWYTLEDLKLWALDEGPIPIKVANSRKPPVY